MARDYRLAVSGAVVLLLFVVAVSLIARAGLAAEDADPEPYRAFIPDAARSGPAVPSPTATATATSTITSTVTVTPTATPTVSSTPTTPVTPTPRPPTATPTATPSPVYVTVVVTQGESSGTVRAEVADTPSKRATGLMYREYLPPDDGMLFLFANDHSGCFWMRNTLIPLDIAFIRSDGVVIIVHEGVPMSDERLCPPPGQQYRNALEVNQGWFEAHGLGVGATVEIVP